jgi:hypothetical protein
MSAFDINNVKLQGMTKEHIKIVPHGTQTFTQDGTNEVVYRLPRRGILDGKALRHIFKCKVDGDAGSDDKVHDNIKSIWNKVVIRFGSTDISIDPDFGHLSTILDNLTMTSDERTTYGAIQGGIPALDSSGTSEKYSHGFTKDGLLDRLIPLFNQPQIELVFYLNQNLAQYTDATTACTELTVDNLALNLTIIHSAELERLFVSQNHAFKITSYNKYTDNKMTAGLTSYSFTVPSAVKSATGILITMRAQADINDATKGDKYQKRYLTNKVGKIQFDIDGVQEPAQGIDCTSGVEPLNYLREFNHGKLGVYFDGDYDTPTDGKFVMGYSFAGNDFDKDVSSGLDLNARTGQVIVNMTNMNVSAPTQIDVWLRFDRFIEFTSDGRIEVRK